MGKSDFTKGVIFTAAGGIGWGISGICGQYIFHEYAVDSSWMTAVRMIFSGLLLLSIVIPKEKSEIFCLFKEKENVAFEASPSTSPLLFHLRLRFFQSHFL